MLHAYHVVHMVHVYLTGEGDGKISASENVTYSGPEKCWNF